MPEIKESIENAIRYLSDHPDEARYTDSQARATLGDTLRVDLEGPGGERIVTDMPAGVGGLGEHPSPGWLFRAAIASCVASTIGMEAAREGVGLGSLVVEVDSESDDRGILGMDPSVPAGPVSRGIRVQARPTVWRTPGWKRSSNAGRLGVRLRPHEAARRRVARDPDVLGTCGDEVEDLPGV